MDTHVYARIKAVKNACRDRLRAVELGANSVQRTDSVWKGTSRDLCSEAKRSGARSEAKRRHAMSSYEGPGYMD